MAVTKRYGAPKFWAVHVKEKKYVVSPRSGPHNKTECMPLGIIMRDILGHARTMKDAKKILVNGIVKINNIVRKDHGFPVGLMDVVDVGGDLYRIVPSPKGLKLQKIDERDAGLRLAKIKNKTYVKKKKIQLNLHDGSNILVDTDEFKTSDVVMIDIGHNLIKDTIRFEKGNFAVVTGGHNIGLKGKIESIDKGLRTVILVASDKRLPVPIKYVFVVGRESPIINIGE